MLKSTTKEKEAFFFQGVQKMNYQKIKDSFCLCCEKNSRKQILFCEECLSSSNSQATFDKRLRIVVSIGINKQLDRLRRGTNAHGL